MLKELTKILNESVQNKLNDNFWKWFNGSKIIDKNGNPLVCYHCTNQTFDTFDKNKIGTSHDMGHYGKGFYFSLSPSHYYGKKCLKCYLNIKNPYFVQYMNNDLIKEFSQLNLIPNNLKPIIKKYNLLKNDFYKNANINVKNIETKYGKNKVYTISYKNKEFTTDESSNYLNSEINDIKFIAWNNLYGDIEYKIHNKLYSNINSEQYTNAIKKLGYDGIIVSLSNSNNIEKSLEIIAFESSQIKSINNNGEWNLNSNNIFESKKINEEAYQYNPLYHGADTNFNKFKKEYQNGGYLGNGFYFTMNKSMAQAYGPFIMQVKLKYQNSFFLSSDILTDQQVHEMLNTTKAQNYQKNNIFNIYKSYITNNAYYDANSKLFDFVDTFNGDSTAILQKYGYDSIDNIDRDSEIVVFEPNQIKIISKEKLNESNDTFDRPYEREDDKSIPKIYQKRKKVLRLKDLNRLKKIRNQQREEMAQDSVFVPILYGPDMSQNEGGDMMGGGMPM